MTVWKLIAHKKADKRDEILRWSEREGVIAVGWTDTGDLRRANAANERAMIDAVIAVRPTRHRSNCTNGGKALWNLFHEMQTGDLVILVGRAGERIVMRITGDYFYVASSEDPYYGHRRPAQRVTRMNASEVWTHAGGGIAAGQSPYGTLVRCALQVE
jgi:predicted Mrr-cat superfamily restriction endonuclease